MFYLGVCFACGTCPGSCSCPPVRSSSNHMVSRSLEAVLISPRPMFSETPCISVVRNQNYRDDVSDDDPSFSWSVVNCTPSICPWKQLRFPGVLCFLRHPVFLSLEIRITAMTWVMMIRSPPSRGGMGWFILDSWGQGYYLQQLNILSLKLK